MKKSTFTYYEKIIIDSIDLESYRLDNDMYLYDKIKTVYNIFREEYIHDNNKFLNERILFWKWLMGFPSVLTVPFYYNEILESALKEGFDLSTEAREDEFLDNYFKNIVQAFFTLKENL